MDKEVSENEIHALLNEAYEKRGKSISKSIDLAKNALEKSRILADEKLIASSLNRLSLFYMITGSYAESEDLANEAIVFYKNIKDDRGIADAKYNLAGIYYKTDNHHKGLIYLTECLHIYKKYKDYHVHGYYL